jgi:D-aminopeptidase
MGFPDGELKLPNHLLIDIKTSWATDTFKLPDVLRYQYTNQIMFKVLAFSIEISKINPMYNNKTFGVFLLLTILLSMNISAQNKSTDTNKRPRVRDIGLKIGILPTGPLNAITDVWDVRVGHTTIIKDTSVRTGVTAILPHGGNIFREKVPAAVFVGNGFGKFMGSTQIEELGEIETPILLTSTLSVPKTGDFLMDYMLGLKGNENVRSINPVVAETNDGYLNDGRGRHISQKDVFYAINNAQTGQVTEGSVGAGTGTTAFGWKGGIGTSSRKLPEKLGGYTVGVLVQTNFGGVFQLAGVPVGVELGNYYLRDYVENENKTSKFSLGLNDTADGSIIMVIATDAPIDARNLKRIAARAMMGLARTGAAGTNGSGDYVIAFSTAEDVRINSDDPGPKATKLLPNNSMSPLFLATIEATEEAIYNSMFKATTITGQDNRTVEALPIDKTIKILRKYKRIK